MNTSEKSISSQVEGCSGLQHGTLDEVHFSKSAKLSRKPIMVPYLLQQGERQ